MAQFSPASPDLASVEPLLAVSDAELAGAAPDVLAERLARLEADRDLMLKLQLQGFTGRDWDAFLNVLAAYGRAVLYAWIFQGTIYRRCADKRIRLGRAELHPKGTDVGDLASDVVVKAIISFQTKVLVPGRWNAAQGATLKTYFIGQCLFQFPNAYRAWVASKRRERAQIVEALIASDLRVTGSFGGNPALHAELGRELARVQQGTNPNRTAALAAEIGFEHDEIGDALGLSSRAVEGRLRRHFRKTDEK